MPGSSVEGGRRVVGEVAVLGGNVGLGVYRREEGEETDKYKHSNAITMHDMPK